MEREALPALGEANHTFAAASLVEVTVDPNGISPAARANVFFFNGRIFYASPPFRKAEIFLSRCEGCAPPWAHYPPEPP